MADVYFFGRVAKKNFSDDRVFAWMFYENFEIPEKIKINGTRDIALYTPILYSNTAATQ